MPYKLDITNLSYDPKTYDYKGSKVAIRPWPASRTDWEFRDGAMVLSGAKRLECFQYCLAGWDFVDAEGKPLPCNAETKRAVFDYRLDPDLVDMVVEKSTIFRHEKEEEEKNYTSGSDTNCAE